MPLHIPDGFAEVTVLFSLTGDPEVMTVAYGVETTAVTAGDVQDLADDQYACWLFWVDASWVDEYALVGVHVKAHIGANYFEAERLEVTPGGAPGSVPVQNTALLVKKSTGLVGRANRGRWYLPPGRLAEVDVNNTGIIDGADVAIIQGEIDDLKTTIEAVPMGGQMHLFHTETAPGVGPDATPITTLTLDNRVATQRRRLRG